MPSILGANTLSSGFDVNNSIKLDNNAYLNRTFDHAGAGGGGGTFTWTLSLWFKRSKVDGNEHVLMSRYVNANKYVVIKINGNDKLEYRVYNFANQCRLTTTATFKDVAAWTHFVIAQDTANNDTAGDRTKFFVNGVRVTAFDTQTNFDADVGGDFNTNSAPHHIGAYNGGDTFQGYFAQVCFVDNVQYDADRFGEFDSDSAIWKPINVSGLSTGATSFFLDFADSGDLGDDESGENNDFTENNIASTDQATDTCTNNFCTLNPNVPTTNFTFSEGNCKIVASGSDNRGAGIGTFGLTAGKWYWEVKIASVVGNHNHGAISELTTELTSGAGGTAALQNDTGVTCWRNDDGGEVVVDGTATTADYGIMADGSIMGIALDMDNYNITYLDDGSALVSDFNMSTTRGTIFPFIHTGINTTTEVNFGGCPAFSISSGNADANGHGNFEHAPPSGYLALCTKNLGSDGG